MKILKNTINGLSLVVILLWGISGQGATDQFQRKTPQQAGYSESELKVLGQYLEKSGSSALLLLHDGKVFYQWGDIYKKHLIHSMRKPLLSGLMGTLYDQGKLDLDATLASLNIDDVPNPLSQVEKQATLAMILKSRSGIYHAATAESEWMKSEKPKRGQFKPGEHYYYNNWDFNLAGSIFEKLSGKKIFEVFNENFAKPLGMQQYDGSYTSISDEAQDKIPDTDGFYQYQLSATKYPAYHFRMSAHDLALYGQLLLNNGEWNGKQLISKEWIDLISQPYSVTNEKYGLAYGMLWNVLKDNQDEQGRHSIYHMGAGLHMLAVYPKYKLVMVHRVDSEADKVTFKHDSIYPIINMMHGARIQQEQKNASN